MKPTVRKVSWLVYTNSEVSGSLELDRGTWAWVAYGPRGSECGVEVGADAALRKAYAASALLTEEGPA